MHFNEWMKIDLFTGFIHSEELKVLMSLKELTQKIDKPINGLNSVMNVLEGMDFI